MTKKQVIFLSGAIAAMLLVAIFIYWRATRGINSPEEFNQVLEEAQGETNVAPPSANPLESVAPAENPVEKTNPFKYENPFE